MRLVPVAAAAYTAEAMARGGVVASRRYGALRLPAPPVVVLALGVAAMAVLAPSAGYDASWHLAWGRELIEGRRPQGALAGAPTAHPLLLLAATVLAPLGPDGAAAVLTVLVGLALGAIVLGVRRVAAAAGVAPPMAIVAGVLAASSPELVRSASVLGSDAFVLAFVVTAGAAWLRQRRAAVTGCLAAAAMLRPEIAVLLALVDRRALLLPLIAWTATGWLVAGDPLHALTGTQALADTLDRPTGLTEAVARFGPDLLGVAGPLTALAGLVVGARALQRRGDPRAALAVPLAFGALAWLALGIAGLPLLERYLLVPGTALVVLACSIPPPRRLGVAVLAAVVLVDGGARAATAVRAHDTAAAARAEARAIRRLGLDGCARVGVTQSRLVPDVLAAGARRVTFGRGAVTIAPTARTTRSPVIQLPRPTSTPTTTAGPYARYGTC